MRLGNFSYLPLFTTTGEKNQVQRFHSILPYLHHRSFPCYFFLYFCFFGFGGASSRDCIAGLIFELSQKVKKKLGIVLPLVVPSNLGRNATRLKQNS